MRRTTSSALSTLDTNGKVTGRNSSPSNWVMRLWPSVSAVTPVWSETKKTVRRLTVLGGSSVGLLHAGDGSVSLRPQGGKRPAGRFSGASLNDFAITFEPLGMHDVERVGGKNASLG